MANKHQQRQNDPTFTPYIPNSASNPYLQQGDDAYAQQNLYAKATQPQNRGYVPPSSNPYIDGPTTGATGYNPERVRTQPRRQRFNTNNGQGLPGKPRRRKRRVPALLVVLLVLLVLGGVGGYLWFFPPFYNVTVNGVTRFVRSGMTLQQAIDEGYVTPTAGNLLAVDGELLTEGAGDAFEATVNDQTTNDPNYAMPKDAIVQINDGKDTTEDYTETTQTVAHGTSDTDYSSASTYYYGPIHIYSAGEDGEETVKTGAISGKTVTEITKQPVDEGYSAFSVNTDQKVIALTFDDGPWGSTTEEILDILAENDAKATFFEIGNQCAQYPDTVKRIISEGHQIATHTYDHASGSGQGVNLTFMSAEEQRQEVEKGFSAIEEVAGTTVSRIMRAPGGNYYGSIITNLSDLVTAEIGWDIDTEDWAKPGVDSIKNAILSATNGDVVLMHDGGGDRSQTVEALRQALPELKAQGYSFVTIDELLAINSGESDANFADASGATESGTSSDAANSEA